MNISKLSFARKLLILTGLIATVSLGWLVGHILRFSMPSLWHPPIEEIDPRIKIGFEFEFEGIRRLAVLPENSKMPKVRVYLGEMPANLSERCAGNTYYTSLPAKCRSVSGELVWARESSWGIILVSLSEVNSKLGNQKETEANREQARKIVDQIAESLREIDLRDSFLEQPRVRMVM